MSKRAIADYPREAADSLGSPLALRRARGTGGPEARALHDDLVGAVSEAVQRAVGEDGIVEEGHPFVHRAVTRDDRGGPPMALDEHIVEIARLLGGGLAQAEVVEEEQVRLEPAPQFPLEGVIGPGLMERLQGDGDAADAVAGAAGTVPEGAGEEGLPHAETAEDDVLLLGQPVHAEEL